MVTISDIRGISTGAGVTVLVTGTASDCDEVSVHVQCQDSESTLDRVPVVDGLWEAKFDPSTESSLQCVCDEDIWVRVECWDDQTGSDEYSGVLNCSEEGCPEVSLSSSIGTDSDAEGRYAVTVTATVNLTTEGRLSARLLYAGNVLDSNTSTTGSVSLNHSARYAPGSYLFTVAVDEPADCPSTSSTVTVPSEPEEENRPCSDDPETSFDVCDPIADSEIIHYRLDYRGHTLQASPNYPADEETLDLLACNTLTEAVLYPAAEHTISQRWHFRRMTRGEVSAVLPLAPGEKLSIRVQRSQRSQLKTSTVDSKEEVRSYESSISDKEVMEAMRTLTKNQQWSVNATAGVSYGVSASVSVGYQESVQRNTSSKLQQVRDATEKASNQLRTLNKIEVTRTTETELINERVRQIANPYRDRAISLVVYELHKHYCVDHTLDSVRPALVLDMPGFEFDRDFVLNNVQFLTRSLLDELLLSDLQSSLAAARRPADLEGNEERLNDFAAIALRHLFFDGHVIPFGDIAIDDPIDSFRDPDDDHSGWSDALGKSFVNDLYVLLASFRYLKDELEQKSSLAETVIALSEQVKELWTQIDEGDRRNLYDTEDRTAVYRRIPAFLALVDKFMRPLLKGPEDGLGGEDGFDSPQRAGMVIDRVVNHLNCFQSYYTEQFHAYLFDLSAGSAHREYFYKFVENVVPGDQHEMFFGDFDLDRAFLDKTSFVIPYRGDSADDVLEEWFPGDPLGRAVEPLRLDVTLPADGAQIEAVPGHCIPLPDIPPPLPSELFEDLHLVVDPIDEE